MNGLLVQLLAFSSFYRFMLLEIWFQRTGGAPPSTPMPRSFFQENGFVHINSFSLENSSTIELCQTGLYALSTSRNGPHHAASGSCKSITLWAVPGTGPLQQETQSERNILTYFRCEEAPKAFLTLVAKGASCAKLVHLIPLKIKNLTTATFHMNFQDFKISGWFS